MKKPDLIVSDDYRYPASLASLPVLPDERHPPAPKDELPNSTAQPNTAPTLSSDAALATANPTRFVQQKLIEGKVIEAIKQIYDPEIPVNIYELGLIYDITVNPDDTVHVKMTLTAPACPVAGSLPGQVETQVETVPEVKSAVVELVWDPPWSRDRMSEAAMLQLGMM
ncbi:MAG TPA: SUF system Fe-S cluster assembly protein [Tepidisphaeraceae bacterium]|jgi:FeS assembly SUF system protein